jgi:hypothetical protein
MEVLSCFGINQGMRPRSTAQNKPKVPLWAECGVPAAQRHLPFSGTPLSAKILIVSLCDILVSLIKM